MSRPRPYVLVVFNPYETDKVERIVGPFFTETEAKFARAGFLAHSARPAATYEVKAMTSPVEESEIVKTSEWVEEVEDDSPGCE